MKMFAIVYNIFSDKRQIIIIPIAAPKPSAVAGPLHASGDVTPALRHNKPAYDVTQDSEPHVERHQRIVNVGF